MMNKKESTSKSKFAASSHKPTAKDLKEDDVEFEIDEYEFDDDHYLVKAVERINRYGIQGNYFNNKYYHPDSYLNEQDWILRYEDNHIYEINEYIYGSAEVVGLMCLQVFTEGNEEQFNELEPYAKKLGSAFQKINFLRDLKDDYQVLGRTYFPNVDMGVFDNNIKYQIEREIEAEFKEALIGIKRLPNSAKFGVYLAYSYYLSLFDKIKNKSSQEILQSRTRIPNFMKAYVAFKSYLRYKVAFL